MSDTPITDAKAHKREVRNLNSFFEVEEVWADEMRALERSHNALIAKLEALAKEWEACKGGYYADFYNGKDSGFRSAGLQIKQLIQEAKQ